MPDSWKLCKNNPAPYLQQRSQTPACRLRTQHAGRLHSNSPKNNKTVSRLYFKRRNSFHRPHKWGYSDILWQRINLRRTSEKRNRTIGNKQKRSYIYKNPRRRLPFVHRFKTFFHHRQEHFKEWYSPIPDFQCPRQNQQRTCNKRHLPVRRLLRLGQVDYFVELKIRLIPIVTGNKFRFFSILNLTKTSAYVIFKERKDQS